MFRWKRPFLAAPAKGSRRRTNSRLAGLVILMLLISVLAAVGFGQYRNSVAAARESVLKADLLRMRNAIHQYFGNKRKYPSSLDSLVAEGYLRAIPEDPITSSRSTWVTTAAQRDPSRSIAEPGIKDVKSGARGTALDGSKYSEW